MHSTRGPTSRFEPILRETRPLGNVTIINNNVVVNKVVNVTYVEQKTNEKVVVHQVEKTEDATKAGKVEGAAVEEDWEALGELRESVKWTLCTKKTRSRLP